jgi:hypothetical protein
VQCVGNSEGNCGDGVTYVAPGSGAAGLVPYRAEMRRDHITNNDWWMWSGYLQDSFSRGRMRINAGLRFDWQQSKWLGGCVPANPVIPDLLPSQCEDATSSGLSPITGQVEELQPFSNWSPRVSLTYDLQGNGKTVVKASGSYYYQTKITLANALSSLGNVTLTWGSNPSSGLCSTSAGASCWNDANMDGFVQANELIGTPSASTSTFDLTTGLRTAVGSNVDPDTKIGRTREVTLGIQRELIANMAVGADFIYRRYDNGTQSYTIGYQPGAAGFPVASIYEPATHTDPVTGNTATYYVVKQGLSRPSGIGNITTTRVSYEDYAGVDLTLSKRYSDRWQANLAVTIQRRNDFLPLGSNRNPTEDNLHHGYNAIARYLIKFNGSYDLPWGIMASTNVNINDGGIRNLDIDGPGQVYGGLNNSGNPTTINYGVLQFEPNGSTRFERTVLWDLGIHKTFTFRGGQNRIKLMVDGFNILNKAHITNFSSNNISLTGSTSNPIPQSQRIRSIIPPRIFRVGASISF